MMANRVRAAVAALLLAVSPAAVSPAAAQVGMGALPAPKLTFSAFELELAQEVAGDPGLAAFYGSNGLTPIFTGEAATPRRAALRAAINQAPSHGLPYSRYVMPAASDRLDARAEAEYARLFAEYARDISTGIVNPARTADENKREIIPLDMADVMARFAGADPEGALAALAPQDARYQALHQILLRQSELVPPSDAPEVAEGLYREGVSGPEVAALRARLASIGFEAESVTDTQIFDADLADAVRRYQQAAGIQADGIAGPQTIRNLHRGPAGANRAVVMAMERLRWLHGYDLNARHVWVNIPEFTTEIRENGQTTFETRAVMGTPDPVMQTPEFSDLLEFVVPNPTWTVPPGMARRTYLPRLAQNPNAYSHLDVVDRRGRVIPRAQVDFARYANGGFPYMLRQQPSADNALGRVKFMFPNEWNIYLHDTPTRHLFNNRVRADSNGCVRIGRPFELAYELLRGNASDPQAYFHRVLDTGQERWIRLEEPLPIHLVYFTTLPDAQGNLRSFPDIYNRDGRLWAALQEAGVE
ncbi:MAG: L,D-transpeptidase family protein [Paracoccus sp. (in: a-proteobacteria)]|nr:L,D-transpeptidase family protein [Paracoccus sp. (in: a-proteobacteria)]